MYMYEQPAFHDEMTQWQVLEASQLPQQNIPHNQLRKKVDSVASLNDIAERDMAEIHQSQAPYAHNSFQPQMPMQMQMQMQRQMQLQGPQPAPYFFDHSHSSFFPQPKRQPDFSTPVQAPLRPLSLNHPVNAPDSYGRPAQPVFTQPQKMEKGEEVYRKRAVSFSDTPVQRAAAPPPALLFSQENAAPGSNNLSADSVSSQPVQSPNGAPLNGEQEFITISFKPQVPLVHGESVKLVLNDFEGPSASDFPIQCEPAGAFERASWLSETKQLDMVLGANVETHQPVTIIVPATAGIRRVPNTQHPEISRSESSPPPATIRASPNGPELSQATDAAGETSPDEETKRQMRIEEKRRAFLEQTKNQVDTPSPPAPPQPSWPMSPPDEGELVFDEIPELPADQTPQASKPEDDLSPMAASDVSQAQWARMRLEQRPDKVQKSVQLDATSVAVQSVWAKKELENRPSHETAAKFDADAVAGQAQWAKERLENRPTHDGSSTLDEKMSEKVASQARWAREQLENRPTQAAETKFDAQAVAEQAKWAKERLELMPQNESAQEEPQGGEQVLRKQELFDAFPDMEDVIDE